MEKTVTIINETVTLSCPFVRYEGVGKWNCSSTHSLPWH